MVHEDTDISDMSLKCLSLIVQLYGAEITGSLTAAHLVRFHKHTVMWADLTSCIILLLLLLLRLYNRCPRLAVTEQPLDKWDWSFMIEISFLLLSHQCQSTEGNTVQ